MKNLFKKYGARVAAVAGLVAIAVVSYAPFASAQTMSTTTLGTSIDTLSGTTYDYFTVLLNKLWPFALGFGILIGVWYLARRFIHSFR